MNKNRQTILYVDQAVSFGGSIVVLGSLVSALDKQKFRPVVVGEMSESILNYHMQDNAVIYVLPRLFNYVQWFKVTEVARKIRLRFFRKIFLYVLSGIRSLANIIYIARLGRIILKEKVDIVHVNNGMNNLEPVIAAILLGRKYIVHFHGVERPGFVPRFLRNHVHKYIVISEYLMEALTENGFPRERMAVIPNPYQESHALSKKSMELRAQYGIEPEDKVFAIVGRIVRWKGHVEFLNAAFIILKAMPEAKALIIGDFSDGDVAYQNQIQKMIDDSGYGDRIIMTGYVEDVGSIYSIMDVCVHTSIEPEPFGLVIIEAMANAVPVIASDRGAPKEIIADGVNGYIVNPDSVQLIADKVIRLLNDDVLRDKMANNAREHVRQHYNEKDYAHALEKLYAEVLS